MIYKEEIRKITNSVVFRDIWQWARCGHRNILCICILNFFVSACSLAITIATRGLIDGATGHDRDQILFYAILMCVTVLAARGGVLCAGILSARTSAVLLCDLQDMVLRKLLKKRFDSLSSFHSGELVNRMFSDVGIVRNGIMEIFPGIVSMVVSFLGAAMILIHMDWHFIIVLIAGGLLGLMLILAFKTSMKSIHRSVQESEGRLHSILQETLEHLNLIKASGSEERMEQQVSSRQMDFVNMQFRKGYFSACMNSSINLVFQLSWLFCMLWGCLGIYRGQLTYGMLAAIIQLVGQIQGPIANSAGVAAKIYGTVSSAERLKELMDLPEEEESVAVGERELYENLREIRLHDLQFSYGRKKEPVMKNVNLRIHRGDFVAVTGDSGGGKSTLFQLLLGIYQPQAGEVQFCFEDGTEEAAARRTRALFAYVPQGNTLFSGTLRENLVMFTDSAADDEIMKAADHACIGRFIRSLSDGLDTVIGERGIGLSEGQAQRIAVARALLCKAPILLLDESTSALDEETEANLLKNLLSLEDKTCLIVTHRRAALQICDYRIHIENGEICVILNDTGE